MAQSLIAIRLTLEWEDAGVDRDYVREMHSALNGVPGFQGGGAWKGADDPHARLLLFSYESPEAAGRGLAAIADLPALIERLSPGASPADVKGIVVQGADGGFAHGVPNDALVSLSVRTADPGYGPEMIDEYEGVFGGLGLLPGYAGSLVGTNAKLPDEIVGLAAWTYRDAFEASMPAVSPYEVVLYEPHGED